MRPTLKDIADRTGLSISTVSRVLRGKAKRNSDNVEAILEAAQHLNYPLYHDDVLDAVKHTKKLFVALVAFTHVGEFYSSLYHGFSRAAKDTNVEVGLFSANPNVDDLIDVLHQLASKSYDAAVLFMPMLSEQDYHNLLAHAPRQMILISAATVFNPVLDTVSFDSYRGGHLVGKHFHDRGYKQVGVVIGNTNRNESLLRKSGFADYIEHHSDMDLIWQYEGDYSIASGKQAFGAFKQLKKKPRAVFLINDNMCLGFMEEARRNGLGIPKDMALVGYDDLPICEYHFPSISSVHTDYEQLARRAINMIKEKLNDTAPPHQGLVSMVPVSLSVKESS